MKRIFDIVASLAGILLLSPFFLAFALLVAVDSGLPIFYSQKRVGKGGKDFSVIKFRTMKKNADREGLLTVGEQDPRITSAGRFLRRYKLDELP